MSMEMANLICSCRYRAARWSCSIQEVRFAPVPCKITFNCRKEGQAMPHGKMITLLLCPARYTQTIVEEVTDQFAYYGGDGHVLMSGLTDKAKQGCVLLGSQEGLPATFLDKIMHDILTFHLLDEANDTSSDGEGSSFLPLLSIQENELLE